MKCPKCGAKIKLEIYGKLIENHGVIIGFEKDSKEKSINLFCPTKKHIQNLYVGVPLKKAIKDMQKIIAKYRSVNGLAV